MVIDGICHIVSFYVSIHRFPTYILCSIIKSNPIIIPNAIITVCSKLIVIPFSVTTEVIGFNVSVIFVTVIGYFIFVLTLLASDYIYARCVNHQFCDLVYKVGIAIACDYICQRISVYQSHRLFLSSSHLSHQYSVHFCSFSILFRKSLIVSSCSIIVPHNARCAIISSLLIVCSFLLPLVLCPMSAPSFKALDISDVMSVYIAPSSAVATIPSADATSTIATASFAVTHRLSPFTSDILLKFQYVIIGLIHNLFSYTLPLRYL